MIFDALDLLLDEGRIEPGKKGRYVSTGENSTDSVEGIIDIITSGAGYVRLGLGKDDIYVSEHNVGTAMHGDRQPH